ncbi:calmodulin-binding protein 60 A-like [Coffea eugenioides]|uniref:calmodulin-binding protein 60 A-like n=1 Tax=Coffea eugenioides TaxID=49369 RepID=UPI000F60F91B|nr:calmodulin-binding protein 60 A-like [Coffea eugenioides]
MVNQKFNSIRNLQEQRFEEMNQRILAIGQRIDKHEVVVEKLLVSSRSNLEKTIQETKQRCMKLKFNSNISVPIRTGEQIKGEGGSNLQLSLIDNCTGAVVDFGREASAKVEIVALKEGLDDDEGDAWTAEQFQSKIARDREGKQYVLAGNLQPKLNKGTVSLSDVMFRSSQRHNGGIFKLGAWVVDTFDGSQVIEAKTKSFKVLDYRGKYTQKHYPPSASDEVWRLENIAKNGATHERLKGANVNYVKDFQTRLSEDPEELKCLVGLRPTQWEATVRHAQTCKPDNMVGQVPAPAPGDACNMLVASAHEDKGIPFDGNIMPALESITLRRKQKLIEPAFEPMIRKIVKEEVDLAMKKYLISIRRTCGKEICPSESGSLQLQFLSGISLPVFTGTRIEGRDFNNLQVALVDPFTGQVVSIGPQSAAKVEIVVLEGDFDGDESDNWTFEEFKNNIVREREGKKPLLTGDAFLTLEQGIGVVSDISITDNSSWTRSRKFRLGARVVDNSDGNRVKEAKTDSFIVRDHRGELYKKHHPPSLADEVWRLEKIGKDGAFHRCLRKERIKTVKDFLTLYFVDPARLRNVRIYWISLPYILLIPQDFEKSVMFHIGLFSNFCPTFPRAIKKSIL